MHHHAVISSLHRGNAMATSMGVANGDRLCFVGVHPIDLEKRASREFLRSEGVKGFAKSRRAYHIRTFEVNRKLLEDDASIGETDLENQTSAIVFGDDALLLELNRIGVAIERLELPCKSDYPV